MGLVNFPLIKMTDYIQQPSSVQHNTRPEYQRRKNACVWLQHSLPESNKWENSHIVAHANDEDEPKRKGEVFHIGQLDHFP